MSNSNLKNNETKMSFTKDELNELFKNFLIENLDIEITINRPDFGNNGLEVRVEITCNEQHIASSSDYLNL